MSTLDQDTQMIADQLAVADCLVRFFELVDAKGWEQMQECLTEDTTARWTPDSVIQGRAGVVGAMQRMIGSDEIITFHHVASMAPVVDGDTARVDARVRAMHYGLGPRAGKFYESLAVQPTFLARTPDGWKWTHHEWNISVKLGSMQDLFAPELARGKGY